MRSNSIHASLLRGTHPQVYISRLGIVILLMVILEISGSVSYATTPLRSLSRKAPQRHPVSTPVIVPTVAPTRPHQAAPLPVLNAPLYSGNSQLPEVALTFDDGPNPFYTPQILAILQQYNVKATFFDVGYLVEDYPDIVRQEFKAGNIVANHSWSHPLLPSLSVQAVHDQLGRTSDAIQAVTGKRPIFFRPPYGSYNKVVIAQAKSFGLSTVIWNDEAHDWTLPGVGVIVSRILSLARNGAIILLHDGGGIRAQTVAALPYIITALRNRGYSFVTIEQMVRHLAGHVNASSIDTMAPKGAINHLIQEEIIYDRPH